MVCDHEGAFDWLTVGIQDPNDDAVRVRYLGGFGDLGPLERRQTPVDEG